jgi:hypothetical protein
MKKPVMLSIAFACVVEAAIAAAYEPNKITTIYGVGSVPCEEYVQARIENNMARIGKFKQWVYGYFTAVSMYYPPANNRHFLDAANSGETLIWIERYCRKNPESNLHDAVKSLQSELLPKDTRRKPHGSIPPAKEKDE